MRFTKKRSRSGCTVRSFLPTMYQLGFDFQAVPPTFASNKSGLGTPWVAQTSFCSCSERSPQKYFVPSGRSQIRPSTTSIEDVGPRELGLLRLRRFIGVRSERADVNQPDNAIVGSGAGDDTSAVGVADEDNGAADPAYRCFRQGNVLCRCVEAVLRRNTFIPLRLKGNDQLTEARAIGPEPVAEYDTLFCLWHICFLCLLVRFICLLAMSRFPIWKALRAFHDPVVSFRAGAQRLKRFLASLAIV